MTDLFAARMTMAVSLGFHIILAAIGMVMPYLMVLAHRRWLKTGDENAYRLTRLWMRGVAIFFATGAVSGTALSFELGILWPGFMKHAGPIIGMPFGLEGAAFFVEAIALGLYFYGWGRMKPKLHLATGVLVGVAGLASGFLVMAANGWMNAPTGFDWNNGNPTNIDPFAAMLNPAWATQSTHMALAAFESVGFAVAGVHAFLLLKKNADPIHKTAMKLALVLGAVAAILQPINGHWAAESVAERQPVKLAAMEAHFETQTNAPLSLGGIPNTEIGKNDGAVEIPGMLSFLAFGDTDAEVKGLNDYPEELWPPVLIVRMAFQGMVALGTWLALLGVIALFAMKWRPKWLDSRRFLWALVVSAPMGFLALELGWVVTEVGRQPWIIHGIMKTKDAVTPVPGQVWHLALFTGLYAMIGISTVWMWRRQVRYAKAMPGPSAELQAWVKGGK